MQSIFVWKSAQPLTHSSTIKYYSGSYWFMEENDQHTKSYQYHRQEQLVPSSNHSECILAWKAEKMGTDWVGSQLLSIKQLPYEKVKDDSYAILEYIGDWVRCIIKVDMEWSVEQLEKEIRIMKEWITKPSVTQSQKDEPCMIRFAHTAPNVPTFHVQTARQTFIPHKTHHNQRRPYQPLYPTKPHHFSIVVDGE